MIKYLKALLTKRPEGVRDRLLMSLLRKFYANDAEETKSLNRLSAFMSTNRRMERDYKIRMDIVMRADEISKEMEQYRYYDDRTKWNELTKKRADLLDTMYKMNKEY